MFLADYLSIYRGTTLRKELLSSLHLSLPVGQFWGDGDIRWPQPLLPPLVCPEDKIFSDEYFLNKETLWCWQELPSAFVCTLGDAPLPLLLQCNSWTQLNRNSPVYEQATISRMFRLHWFLVITFSIVSRITLLYDDEFIYKWIFPQTWWFTWKKQFNRSKFLTIMPSEMEVAPHSPTIYEIERKILKINKRNWKDMKKG